MTIQEMNNNPMTMIANLVDRYHAEPDSFTEEQAEKLALIAFETNTPFRPQTKKLNGEKKNSLKKQGNSMRTQLNKGASLMIPMH